MTIGAILRQAATYLLVFASAAIPLAGQGASFDCKSAKTAVEKAICADEELSRLDSALGSAYRTALKNTDDQVALRREQKEWLRNRNTVCDEKGPAEAPDHSCLVAAYAYRVWKLAPKRDEADPLRAGRYRVGWGWNRPVCRELVAYLNDHPSWPPLSCGFRADSSNPDIALPAWKPLDIRSHREVLKAIWDEGVGPMPIMSKTDTDRIFEERFNSGNLELAEATFDVNNSGHPMTVYRAQLEGCDPSNGLAFDAPGVPRLYAVQDGAKRRPNNTFVALTSPPRDVFLYKGNSHLAWWLGRHTQGVATLGIYLTSAPGAADVFAAKPVCTLSYSR